MLKRLLMGMLLIVPHINADWIDDLAILSESGTMDQLKAENIVQTYVDSDENEIKRLEKKADANDEDGFWATVRGGAYQLQWASTKASLRYHKKVRIFIKELPKNERDQTTLIENLKVLRKLEGERVELKERYQKSSSLSDSLKVGGLIAAKEVQINAHKAYIKSSFII